MFYSEQKKQYNILSRRSFFLYLFKIILFGSVGWRLYDIQIVNSKKYKTLSKNNQIDLEIIYPLRGEILDRNKRILVSNKIVYDVYLIPENTNSINETLNILNNYFIINFAKRRKIIDLSNKLKKFEKIKILENIDWNTLEKIEINKFKIPGIIIFKDYIRVYHYNDSFSHILGYINKPNQEELSLPYIAKMPKLDVGKQGLEHTFNKQLIGKSGQREIEVNSTGRVIREISKIESKKGSDVIITIDSRLQIYVANLLKSHKAGSVIVMDITTGEILSMVSEPTYDPNKIIKKPNKEYWIELLNNKLSPLTNRGTQGLYSPGSTFKMIVAIAGLKYGVIDNNSKNFCNGKIEFGDRLYHCWKNNGHGSMNVSDAIKESCDVFFYEVSKKIGIDKIAKVAKEFGLGQIFDTNLENQNMGIIPSKKWKKNKIGESWYAGETLIAGIGQGFVLTNPLQLAVMISIIASDGKKIIPTILKRDEYQIFENDKYYKEIQIVKKAMYRVVNENKGTAFKSRLDKIAFSGKTGTSQVKRISLEERESDDFRKKEEEWKNRDHALFVGYFPSDKPKYSISVVIEHGGSGASTAAPIAKKIFNFIEGLNI